MAWNNRKIRPVSAENFFALNSGRYSYEEFAEKVYMMMHTFYLNPTKKIKVEMGRIWDEDFGVYMTDETFEFMLVNEPIMLRDVIVENTRNREGIKSNKYLEKSLVAFEFDLWMIENYRVGNALRLGAFEKYITERYGNFLDERYRSFKKYDLLHIESFEKLAKGLDPYYDQIREIFELVLSNNRMRIPFEMEFAERVVENKGAAPRKPDREQEKKQPDSGTDKKQPAFTGGSIADILAGSKEAKRKEPAENTTGTKESDSKAAATKTTGTKETDSKAAGTMVTPDKTAIQNPGSTITNEDIEHAKQDLRKKIDREYTLIIKDKDDRIDKLEKDIKEFKRQRDEAREYSVNQYDRGIKDLFSAMNDARYGKVIDYLYSKSRSPETEENLASYLDNLFMALEDMEIEPIIQDDEIVVNEETMLKEYNLDFNKTDFDKSKVRLKYAGWTFKDTTMEKPSITMTEE